MSSSLGQFADTVPALAGLALGTAVGLAPLALAGARDPFDAGASYVFWLVGGLVSAAVVASLDPGRSRRYGIAVAAGFPLGFMLLVALTPVAWPGLYPLTMVMLALVGLCAALPGAALGRRLSVAIGDWSAEGRTGIAWALIAAGAVAVGVFAHRAKATSSLPPEAPPAAVVTQSAPGTPLRVVEVTLRAEPSEYSGRCPTLISFHGRIMTAGGRGPVAYRFMRSDNATAPIERVEVDGASSEVETTWTLGGPGWTFEGWQALSVLEPQPVTSAPARFRVRCAP